MGPRIWSKTMKGLFLTAALGAVCVSTFGQGTLNFANAGVGLQAKITNTDGTGLSGNAWTVDLFWARGVVTDSASLIALGAPTFFSTVPSQAGFFFGGPRTIPTAPGVITAQLRVWDTASGSYLFARGVGESILFQVTLADPNATPPGIPTSMTGLNGHPFQIITVPEPSALGLAALGLAMVLRCGSKKG
jgi:hypothetical protein